MSDMITPYGEAKDGKIFNVTSPEVQKELSENSDLTLEAAIGNVVEEHNKSVVDEPASEDSESEDAELDEATEVAEATEEDSSEE